MLKEVYRLWDTSFVMLSISRPEARMRNWKTADSQTAHKTICRRETAVNLSSAIRVLEGDLRNWNRKERA